ncbi:hypothetical protein EE612_050287 [Oryza sativa]|nr:hypothetical protein EE612_050287 [Oryza sativa]
MISPVRLEGATPPFILV